MCSAPDGILGNRQRLVVGSERATLVLGLILIRPRLHRLSLRTASNTSKRESGRSQASPYSSFRRLYRIKELTDQVKVMARICTPSKLPLRLRAACRSRLPCPESRASQGACLRWHRPIRVTETWSDQHLIGPGCAPYRSSGARLLLLPELCNHAPAGCMNGIREVSPSADTAPPHSLEYLPSQSFRAMGSFAMISRPKHAARILCLQCRGT